MMAEIFLKILNMSISASWIVLAVLLLRALLKKAPKWINGVLWGIVGLRLVMPFSLESVFSLIPSAQTISKAPDAPRPYITSGVTAVDIPVNEYLEGHYFEGVSRPEGHFVDLVTVLALVWVIGMAVLLLYTAISYLRLRNKVGTAVLLRDNIFQSESVASPFVLGMIKPKVYLPFHMNVQAMEHVIAHEQAHICRKDHWWKPLGFLLLTFHWFNPLMWFGYVLLCRDIEIACDEKVVKGFAPEQKADYAQALLSCSVNRRLIAACPLAFGEVGVRDRVKSVLNYKKPAFWVIAVGIVASIAAAVCFLTDPISEKWQSDNYGIHCHTVGAECDNVEFSYVYSALDGEHSYICVNWTNNTLGNLCYGEHFVLYKDGEVCHRTEAVITHDLMHVVGSGKSQLQKYGLLFYDLQPGEVYRLETKFHLGKDATQEYTAYLEFSVDTVFSFVGKQYAGEKIVYENGSYSSVIYTDDTIAQFMIARQTMELLTAGDTESSAWRSIGALQPIVLEKENFDQLFTSEIWEKGYSPKKLRRENLNAFSVFDGNGTWYYLLEQKNGDIYIAQSNGETADFRWLFRMREADITVVLGEPNTGPQMKEIITEPPALFVISNDQSIEALMGTSSWTYQKEDGTAVAICADGMHPLAQKEAMSVLDLLPTYVNYGDPFGAYMQFYAKKVLTENYVPPDTVTVRCWPEEQWGNTDAVGEEVEVRTEEGNRFLSLKDGNYIYEVVASWNVPEMCNGTVRYCFRTAKRY